MAEEKTAAEALQEQAEEANKAAIDARDDKVGEGESDEEYAERIRLAQTTGIFGDTPTDPTTGDVVVPTSDEEQGGVDVAAKDVAADEGDEEAEETSDKKAKRQSSAPAQEVQDKATAEDAADKDDSDKSAQEKAAEKRQASRDKKS